MFTLDDYTKEERVKAAKACGTADLYLWQCGKGMRSPGKNLMLKLIKHDKRLTLEALMAPKIKRDRQIVRGKIKPRIYKRREV